MWFIQQTGRTLSIRTFRLRRYDSELRMASGGGLCGAFTVEENQIGGIWCCAELAKHCGDLAAVVRAMVHEVLQHLPERSCLRNAFGGFMLDYSGDVFFF